MEHGHHHVYISGGLTNLSPEDFENFKNLYEKLGELCESMGFKSYVPHKFSDPVKHAHLTPQQVDRLDRDAVTYSCLMITVVDNPSLGVGVEIEMAYHANKPVWLAHHKDAHVSALPLGNPTVTQVLTYETHEDLLEQIKEALILFILPPNLP